MCDSSADAEPEAWPGQEPGCAVRRRWRWLAMTLAAALPTVLRKGAFPTRVACIGAVDEASRWRRAVLAVAGEKERTNVVPC